MNYVNFDAKTLFGVVIVLVLIYIAIRIYTAINANRLTVNIPDNPSDYDSNTSGPPKTVENETTQSGIIDEVGWYPKPIEVVTDSYVEPKKSTIAENRFKGKFTDIEIRSIRASDLSNDMLAIQYDVSAVTIRRIKAKQTYKHVI